MFAGISRTTANGGVRLISNTEAENFAQTYVSFSGTGGEIGRQPHSSANGGYFDLYEIAIYNIELSDAVADANASAMKTKWNIHDFTNRLILEGDSITDGIGGTADHENPGAVLSEPGGAYELPGWLVYTSAFSGSRVSTMITRRDATSSPFSFAHFPGRNVAAAMTGRNDASSAGDSEYSPTTSGSKDRGSEIVDALVGFYNTTTTGVLQRGFEAYALTPIASSSAFEDAFAQMRTEMAASTFLDDCNANGGDAFDGLLTVVQTEKHTVDGDRIFDTVADASDTNWYWTDQTHLEPAGSEQLAALLHAAVTARSAP